MGAGECMIRCQPILQNNCERTEVFTASCERNYEGIGFIQEKFMCGIKAKADVRRYDKKCTYASKVSNYS